MESVPILFLASAGMILYYLGWLLNDQMRNLCKILSAMDQRISVLEVETRAPTVWITTTVTAWARTPTPEWGNPPWEKWYRPDGALTVPPAPTEVGGVYTVSAPQVSEQDCACQGKDTLRAAIRGGGSRDQ